MATQSGFPNETSADWCERFFTHPDYLDIYRGMTGPLRTKTELKFCKKFMGWSSGQSVLDAPCGAGRHSIPMARKGLRVTGLDFSGYLLSQAQRVSSGAFFQRPQPEYVQGLIQRLPFQENAFDFIVNLFSSFGYLDSEDENAAVVAEYARVLKPGGKLCIDVMNRHFIVPRLNDVFDSVHDGGLFVREERSIIDNGRRMHNQITVTDGEGRTRKYLYRPWLYNGWELAYFAVQAGLNVDAVYGDFHGAEYSHAGERAILIASKS